MMFGSMSSMREIEEPAEPEPCELIRMPSTKTIGSLFCVSDALPRMRMRIPSPARPDVESPTTPGTRPCSSSDVLLIGAYFGGSIVATVLPSRFTSVAPAVPVVTTACSAVAETASVKSWFSVPPAVTVIILDERLYPKRRTFTSSARAGTFDSRYPPTAFVTVTSAAAEMLTVAPAIGRPVPASFTIPSTAPTPAACCADKWVGLNPRLSASAPTTAAPVRRRIRERIRGCDSFDIRGTPSRGVGHAGSTGQNVQPTPPRVNHQYLRPRPDVTGGTTRPSERGSYRGRRALMSTSLASRAVASEESNARPRSKARSASGYACCSILTRASLNCARASPGSSAAARS